MCYDCVFKLHTEMTFMCAQWISLPLINQSDLNNTEGSVCVERGSCIRSAYSKSMYLSR